MIAKNDVSKVKNSISRCVGSKVQLRSLTGRQKSTVTRGTIENVYPSIFTILLEGEEEFRRKVSYSYTDILTRAVEITVFE